MSLAIPIESRGRSGSGETQARPKATGPMTEKYALVLYLNEKSCIGRKVNPHDVASYLAAAGLGRENPHYIVRDYS